MCRGAKGIPDVVTFNPHRDYAPCLMRKRRVREVKASLKATQLARGRTRMQLQVIQSEGLTRVFSAALSETRLS